MESILDFSQDLDVDKLDLVVKTFYTGVGEQYIALQILEKLIQTRWKILPPEQQMGIIIVATSENEQSLHKEKTYLSKLNLILVQILKQEWPHNWPQFIPEIVSTGRSNLNICENNMAILKLLRQIFDYSAEQMTQIKTKNLKARMCNEFSKIFELCNEVLQTANQTSLIKATLETLLKFLNWIPLGYIFETSIIDNLWTRFIELDDYRNLSLKCMTEIAAISIDPEHGTKLIQLFSMVVTSLDKLIPLENVELPVLYNNSSNEFEEFIQNLALFLTSFLTILELPQNRSALITAHYWLLRISQVEEREVFKSSDLYAEITQLPVLEMPLLSLTGVSSAPTSLANIPLRKHIYVDILSNLRVVMIDRMVKPEEVLVVENEEGEVIREFMKDSDTITLYKSMRECLVYLTNLDVQDTESIMSNKLTKQVDGSEWSWNNLCKLCWAIGSISGAMYEDTEKRFLVTVIKELLGLCEQKRGKENKAIVASNIILCTKHMKARVQDMACDTFIKIAQKCRRQFIIPQQGESVPFVDEILNTIETITKDLSHQQVQTFYEAVGYMISAQTNKTAQERLVAQYMELPNAGWDRILTQISQNLDALNVPENTKMLGHILKTNVAACSAVGGGFSTQIARIYFSLFELYKAVSQLISDSVAKDGLIATKTPRVRNLRVIKKETLKLMEVYITKAEDTSQIITHLMPPFLTSVLIDYNTNVEPARDAEVLSSMAAIISKLGASITNEIPSILSAVFECTLNMINKDFSEYPEHRVGFFKLLRAINQHCFPALLTLPAAQFKLIMDSIVWAFKHTMRDIADTGLHICLELLNNISNQESAVANAFYQQYYLNLLQDVFFVLTDTDHKSGLFELNQDNMKFKLHLRDFLIQLKEFAGDNADLYLEEREAEAELRKKTEMANALKIPGLEIEHRDFKNNIIKAIRQPIIEERLKNYIGELF
ncbi:18772_t:CDS:10 [Entrophospora sp. SA101]|nr:18772_t:CDS:10 [Entrophospora sp. SA101]